MTTVVLRVWLPDRPGALGQVASRIGAVRGEILGIEILESGGGRVIDELVIALDDAGLVELMVAEVGAVDGVSVEHVRPVDGDRVDPDLTALSVGVELAEAAVADRLEVLCHGTRRVGDAEWAVVVRGDEVLVSAGEPPALGWLTAFVAGAEHLDASVDPTGGAPSDLLWAVLPRAGVAVVAGRSDRPVHERERTRIAMLARVADALI